MNKTLHVQGYLPNKVGADKIELAHWGAVAEKRAQFMKSLPSRVGELQFTKKGPVLPITPAITNQEADISKHPIKDASLFTFTSKMSCASFSIAAGPWGKSHGTCLAANLSKPAFVKASREVEMEGGFGDSAKLESIGHRNTEKAKSVRSEEITGMYICDACYAGKGNYARLDSVQIYQVVRKIWADRALARGTFVTELTEAMSLLLHNESLMGSKLAASNFFRIHDSGDFYSVEYMIAWFEACRQMPDVTFWAPTRMWVSPEYRAAMRMYKPANLTLRPSALVYGSLAPLVPGLDAGSTSSRESLMNERDCHWDCPAYLSKEGSCASARCRTCWTRPDVPVNYKVH